MIRKTNKERSRSRKKKKLRKLEIKPLISNLEEGLEADNP